MDWVYTQSIPIPCPMVCWRKIRSLPSGECHISTLYHRQSMLLGSDPFLASALSQSPKSQKEVEKIFETRKVKSNSQIVTRSVSSVSIFVGVSLYQHKMAINQSRFWLNHHKIPTKTVSVFVLKHPIPPPVSPGHINAPNAGGRVPPQSKIPAVSSGLFNHLSSKFG